MVFLRLGKDPSLSEELKMLLCHPPLSPFQGGSREKKRLLQNNIISPFEGGQRGMIG